MSIPTSSTRAGPPSDAYTSSNTCSSRSSSVVPRCGRTHTDVGSHGTRGPSHATTVRRGPSSPTASSVSRMAAAARAAASAPLKVGCSRVLTRPATGDLASTTTTSGFTRSPTQHGGHVADRAGGAERCAGDLRPAPPCGVRDVQLHHPPSRLGRPHDGLDRVAGPPVLEPEGEQGLAAERPASARYRPASTRFAGSPSRPPPGWPARRCQGQLAAVTGTRRPTARVGTSSDTTTSTNRCELPGIQRRVAVHHRDQRSGGRLQSGVTGRAVAATPLRDDRRPQRGGHLGGPVGRAVVDDDRSGADRHPGQHPLAAPPPRPGTAAPRRGCSPFPHGMRGASPRSFGADDEALTAR